MSRSEEHTSELQSQFHLVCRLLLEIARPPGSNLFPYTTLFRSVDGHRRVVAPAVRVAELRAAAGDDRLLALRQRSGRVAREAARVADARVRRGAGDRVTERDVEIGRAHV